MRAKRFKEEERPMMERTSLHAYRLRLDHPVTEERMEFKAELPKDFQAVINKKLRSSVDKRLQQVAKKDGGKSAIHLVEAWCSELKICLGQYKTEDKSNEITAIPALLDLLEIQGCLISIDGSVEHRITGVILSGFNASALGVWVGGDGCKRARRAEKIRFRGFYMQVLAVSLPGEKARRLHHLYRQG